MRPGCPSDGPLMSLGGRAPYEPILQMEKLGLSGGQVLAQVLMVKGN